MTNILDKSTFVYLDSTMKIDIHITLGELFLILKHMRTQVIFLFQVNVSLKKAGSKMEHQGIKIEFIGQIG